MPRIPENPQFCQVGDQPELTQEPSSRQTPMIEPLVAQPASVTGAQAERLQAPDDDPEFTRPREWFPGLSEKHRAQLDQLFTQSWVEILKVNGDLDSQEDLPEGSKSSQDVSQNLVSKIKDFATSAAKKVYTFCKNLHPGEILSGLGPKKKR